MKVLLPPQKSPENVFERMLQRNLEKSDLEGYALLGFSFLDCYGKLHEIDAVLVLFPGIFICLEAKNYVGLWTGSPNEVWKCDGQEIKAIGTNPYVQCRKYAFVIKKRLDFVFCPYGIESKIFVNNLIVAPNKARFQISTAIINDFECGSRILICNLSALEKTIASISVNNEVQTIVKFIGLETIVRSLANLSRETNLENLVTTPEDQTPPDQTLQDQTKSKKVPTPKLTDPKSPPSKLPTPKRPAPKLPAPTLSPPTVASPKLSPIKRPSPKLSLQKIPPPKPIKRSQNQDKSSLPDRSQTSIKKIKKTSSSLKSKNASTPRSFLTILKAGLFSIVTIIILLPLLQYFFKTPITKNTIVVGSVNSEKDYLSLQNYLDQNLISANIFDILSGQDISVNLQASRQNRPYQYPEAIGKIRNYQWDIVFSYSPVIAIEAEDAGYQFVARMFPDTPGYQSTFFVREDSSIRFEQLSSNYTIALGSFFSASRFYMPLYDLYGSSLKVMTNLSPETIENLVKTGKADIGVGVINEKLPKGLKILKTSRNLPGAGVYLSPKLSPQDLRQMRKLLLKAPQDIKIAANYNIGTPSDYQNFRRIVSRVREVTACSDFEKNPVTFTCGDQIITTIEGEITAIEISGQWQELTITQSIPKRNSVCKVLVRDATLKMAIDYTSVFNVQGRKVRFYVGYPKGQHCSPSRPKLIYQPNQIEILN